jgi:hypothetical protein
MAQKNKKKGKKQRVLRDAAEKSLSQEAIAGGVKAFVKTFAGALGLGLAAVILGSTPQPDQAQQNRTKAPASSA